MGFIVYSVSQTTPACESKLFLAMLSDKKYDTLAKNWSLSY